MLTLRQACMGVGGLGDLYLRQGEVKQPFNLIAFSHKRGAMLHRGGARQQSGSFSRRDVVVLANASDLKKNLRVYSDTSLRQPLS